MSTSLLTTPIITTAATNEISHTRPLEALDYTEYLAVVALLQIKAVALAQAATLQALSTSLTSRAQTSLNAAQSRELRRLECSGHFDNNTDDDDDDDASL